MRAPQYHVKQAVKIQPANPSFDVASLDDEDGFMNMTEKTVSVSDLKAHLSECLRRVKDGERWTVTERGRPVAVLGPSPTHGDELAELAAAGVVRLGNSRLPSEFWDLPQSEDPTGSVRRALLEERAEGW